MRVRSSRFHIKHNKRRGSHIPHPFDIVLFLHGTKRSSVAENMFLTFLKDFIYLFLDTGAGREKESERNIHEHPLLGTWPTTQACTLTGNPTDDPLVCRPVLNPLSHTSQGCSSLFQCALHL